MRQIKSSLRFLFIGGLVVIFALVVWPRIPRSIQVSLRLPEGLTALTVEYRDDAGDLVRAAQFRWSGPSPDRLRLEPELRPGRFELLAVLRDTRGREVAVRRSFEADPSRTARVDLRRESETDSIP